MPEQSNDYRVVVFGAGGVGKSSLVLRFVKGTFRDTYIPTVEDTYRQVISCDKSVCTLQITDTTGSHQFPAMQRLSISKGHAFILVYSITSKQSLEELKPIYQQVGSDVACVFVDGWVDFRSVFTVKKKRRRMGLQSLECNLCCRKTSTALVPLSCCYYRRI